MPELKSNYKILKEHNLLIVIQTGNLNINSMMEFIFKLHSNPLFSPKFNHIIDLNNIIFDLSTEDIQTYIHSIESKAKIFGKKRIALITNTPNQVVYSTLFKEAQEQLQPLKSVQIFSTTQKAYDFMRLKNISFQEVSQTLKELKKELTN